MNNEETYRNTIMELENFIQFDADVLFSSLLGFAYDLEEAINRKTTLEGEISQLLTMVEIYKRQRAKISTPEICSETSMIRQRFPYVQPTL